MSHTSSPRSGMLNHKLSEVFSLVCTLGNSNIAVTVLRCTFESTLVWKHSLKQNGSRWTKNALREMAMYVFFSRLAHKSHDFAVLILGDQVVFTICDMMNFLCCKRLGFLMKTHYSLLFLEAHETWPFHDPKIWFDYHMIWFLLRRQPKCLKKHH